MTHEIGVRIATPTQLSGLSSSGRMFVSKTNDGCSNQPRPANLSEILIMVLTKHAGVVQRQDTRFPPSECAFDSRHPHHRARGPKDGHLATNQDSCTFESCRAHHAGVVQW